MDSNGLRESIAKQLRSLRKERSLSLEDVAGEVGISKSQLSRMERGLQDVSVIELMEFARVYGVNVVAFFLEEDDAIAKVTRLSERRRVVRNVSPHGTVIQELITRARNVKMEPSLLFVPALADSGAAITHEGEEFITVLDGSLRVWIGERMIDLGQGDTLYYPCAVPHRWRNLADRPAVVLAVSTPPSY